MAGREQTNPDQPPAGVPVIDGYSDLQLIGSGGYSQVYTAWQERFARTVAIKVITVELSATALRRFGREQTTTGQLDGHPHVIRVYDSGFTEHRQPYLTMEYHELGSLADRVRCDGPLPLDEVLAIGVKLACALDAAHRHGTIHRDVKPQNVLVSPFVGPVLADFGIAAVDDARIRTITSEAFSALHVAPEVLEGHQATAASDLYSLASTMYELLAGTAPFADSDDPGLLALMRRIRTEPLPSIDRDDLPPQLPSLLSRMLARDIDDRPSSGLAMAGELRALEGELGLQPTPLVPSPNSSPSATERPTEMPPPAWTRSPAANPSSPPDPSPVQGPESPDLETTDPRAGSPSAAPATPTGGQKLPKKGRDEAALQPPGGTDEPETYTIERPSRPAEGPKPLITEDEKKSRLPWIIGLSTVFVLLFGAAGWFFLLRDTSNNDEGAPTTTATTEPDPADRLPPCPSEATGTLFPDGSPDIVESQPPSELGLEQDLEGTSAHISWDDPNGGASYYVVFALCDIEEQDDLQPVAMTSPGDPTEAVVEDLDINLNYCFTVGVWTPRETDTGFVDMHDGDPVCMDDPTGPDG